MFKFVKHPYCIYSVLIGLILSWWFLAFRKPGREILTYCILSSHDPKLSLENAALFPYLSPLSREKLHLSLSGNIEQMIQCITEWDIDAQILESKGVIGIQRLSKEDYLQAHLLSRLLTTQNRNNLHRLNCQLRLPEIIDDANHRLVLKDSFHRFLPQTYVAASFLLAIASSEEIVTIPKGLRMLSHLYSPELLKKIPDIDETEKLYLEHPDIAFIAFYSHPPTLNILLSQGIERCTINNINTIEDIQNALLKVGHASNHPGEANMLNLFMSACLMTIDNRLRALHQSTSPHFTKPILFLYHDRHFMMPTEKSLSGQLLKRAMSHHPGIACSISSNPQEWRTLYSQEKILQHSGEELILAMPFCRNQQNLEIDLPCNTFKQIFLVDETVQESPTQYIVLAYFDLFQAFARALHL